MADLMINVVKLAFFMLKNNRYIGPCFAYLLLLIDLTGVNNASANTENHMPLLWCRVRG